MQPPVAALDSLAAVVLLGVFGVCLGRIPVLSLVDVFGTFTGLSFVLLYSLANVAAPRYLLVQGRRLAWFSLFITLLVLPFLTAVLWGTVHPWPQGPVGGAVLGFALTVAATLTVGIYWHRYRPERLQRVLDVEY